MNSTTKSSRVQVSLSSSNLQGFVFGLQQTESDDLLKAADVDKHESVFESAAGGRVSVYHVHFQSVQRNRLLDH